MSSNEYSQVSWIRRLADNDFVQKVGETFVARVAMVVIGLATSVLVARALGPEGRGLVAAAGALTAVGVQFGNLGLHAANTYYVARDRSLLPMLIGNSLVIGAVAGGVLAFGVAVVAVAWPGTIPVRGTLLTLALVGIPVGIALLLLENLLLGIHEVRAYNIIEVGTRVFAVAAIVGLFMADAMTPELIVALTPFAAVLGIALALRRLRRHVGDQVRPSLSLIGGHASYGFKAYLAALFSFLVLRFDLLMVEDILGSAQTGYYSIATSMADMVYMLPVVIGTILFPKLSAMSSRVQKWRAARKVALGTFGIMVGLVGVAMLLAGPIVRLLYGEAFEPAIPAFMLLMPGIVALGTNVVLMNYFASTGMPWVTFVSPLAAVAANVGLNLVLIPSRGIEGAAIASVVAYSLMLMISLVYLGIWESRKLTATSGERNV